MRALISRLWKSSSAAMIAPPCKGPNKFSTRNRLLAGSRFGSGIGACMSKYRATPSAFTRTWPRGRLDRSLSSRVSALALAARGIAIPAPLPRRLRGAVALAMTRHPLLKCGQRASNVGLAVLGEIDDRLGGCAILGVTPHQLDRALPGGIEQPAQRDERRHLLVDLADHRERVEKSHRATSRFSGVNNRIRRPVPVPLLFAA